MKEASWPQGALLNGFLPDELPHDYIYDMTRGKK